MSVDLSSIQVHILMELEWQYVFHALPFLMKGAMITIAVSSCALLLGLIIGTITSLISISIPLFRPLITLYVSFVRGTPLIMQVLFVYYALPAMGMDLPRFQSGVIALGLNSGAYIFEIMRGGMKAISKGQIDAAKASGMESLLIWRRIVLPQAMIFTLPSLTIEFSGLIKASALLSVIGLIELTRRAQEIVGETLRSPEVWITTAIIYFVICHTLGYITRRIELYFQPYRI